MITRAVPGLVRALAATWRVQVHGAERLAAARAAGPVLFAPWHETLIPLVWHHRGQGITLLVGTHADAAMLARAAGAWGYALARGSSTRGAASGLRALVRALRAGGDAAVTPDGPRGPRRTAKRGLFHAARVSGAQIVPVWAAARPMWRLRSWDRLMVPAPGAHITVRYGVPWRADTPGHGAGTGTEAARLAAELRALEQAS